MDSTDDDTISIESSQDDVKILVQNDNEIQNDNKILAHNGKEISSASVSPNGTYVVTYSKDDNSIEGWIVNEDDGLKWIPLERDSGITLSRYDTLYAVNDDKTVFIEYLSNTMYRLKALRLNECHQPIKLNLEFESSCKFLYY